MTVRPSPGCSRPNADSTRPWRGQSGACTWNDGVPGFGAAGPKLGEMKRVLLAKLSRRGEALDSAWSEYQAHPGRSTYEERMRWTPPPSARSGPPRRLLCPRRGTSLRYKFWNTLPLELTAALATWARTRRIIRLLPWGLRLFLETSADSSRPGHTPTQDAHCCGDGNEAADGPTSARICGDESMPKPALRQPQSSVRLGKPLSSRSSCQGHLRLSTGARRPPAAMRGSHAVNKYFSTKPAQPASISSKEAHNVAALRVLRSLVY